MAGISVIVPVYKVEKYINRCINSILAQTYTDYELILVDDGSPDNCGTICDSFAQLYDRIHVIHQSHSGLSSARNAGIDWVFANSDSQWLTFIDSDDWVHSSYLSCLLTAVEEKDARISLCQFAETTGDEPEIAEEQLETQIRTPEGYFVDHNINATIACAKLYHRSCFQTIRYPVGKLHEDEFITYQILFKEKQIVVCNAPLYFYFQNAEGITKSPWMPERMHVIDALKEQTDYFRSKGFVSAHKRSVRAYINAIMRHYLLLNNSALSKGEKTKHNRYLRKRLRAGLFRYRKTFPLLVNFWIYEAAFPNGMKLYWIGVAVIKRIKKLFGAK